MFEGIIYDLDGVILDSSEWQVEAWSKYLSKFEAGISPEDLRTLVGRRAYDIAEYLYRRYDLPSDPLTIYEEQQEVLMEMAEERVEPLPGLYDSIEMFKTQGFKLATVSPNPRDFMWQVLEKLQIDEAFDVVVAGDMVNESRPSPIQLAACAETFALHPAYCLVLEQSRNGIEAARNASMRVICVLNRTIPRWRAVGADLVLNNLDEINMQLVRSLYLESDGGPRPQPQLQRDW